MKNSSSKPKTVVVLGSQGFIGSHLVSGIAESGFNVVEFTSRNPLFTKKGRLTIDLHEASDIFWFLTKINPIVASRNQKLIEEELQHFQSALKSLYQANENHRVIFPSSGGTIYGASKFPCSESHRIDPVNQYGHYKFAMEEILRGTRLPHTVLRISNVFGPNQPTGRGQGVISEWIQSIMSRSPLKLYGSDETSRDFIYIDDLVVALSMCISRGQLANIYNIGSGVSSTLRQVLLILQDVTNTNFKIELVPKRLIDRMAIEIDISLATADLDWNPDTSLRQGIEKLWNSVRSK